MKSNNALLKQGDGAFAGIVLSQQYGETIVREHIKRNKSNTPDQQAHRAQWGSWGVSWGQCSQEQIAGFTRLAVLVTAKEGRKRPLSNYAVYAQLNDLLASVNGATPVQTAPLLPETPDTLGALTLNVSLVGGVLHMTVASDKACVSACQIWATEFFAPGRNTVKDNAFRQIGSADFVPGPGSSLNLASRYTDKFGPIPPGQKVAVRLVPVSPSGFRSAYTYTVLGICGDTVAQPAETEPETINGTADAALSLG